MQQAGNKHGGPTAAPVVLGLHIGGSKTHAVLSGARGPGADSDLRLEITEARANLSSVGHQGADAVLRRIAARVGGGVEAVCAGAAGADTPASRAVLSALLSEHFPGARIEVVHDTRIILAAAGLEAGVVLVAGTGSVAWGRNREGREARSGGYGYLLGDEGGGYSVVRDAVREALREYYAGLEPGPLVQSLMAATASVDALQLMDFFYAKPEPDHWAGLAPLVLDLAIDGDPAALRIQAEAAHSLASLARQVLGELGLDLPLVMAGALLVNQSQLAAAVARKMSLEDPSLISILPQAPVFGAVKLARRLIQQ
ncbi:N-acetylglucosamine kinase [Paenarthrobacter nitroguajacolicus]|uniref:N-acetylglucosamine kinase n=1 Tax=Paenarthrobacter nitroguajacolicus TaxID=211146 RepID=UPI00248B88CA|nr:BadF/BadG/BcrA/BcrD ATPase family protein [Paenarthrobacter nitroguajacolicus]MDI2033819.1 N-acetylmuramic acid/N-acetylglucosamine kinase [Paenarthrobacter nitroguajacolicus]